MPSLSVTEVTGERLRKRILRGMIGASALASGLIAVTAAATAADAAPALGTVNIACGDVAGLKAAIIAANLGGPSTIVLASNCTYTLTAADNTSLSEGANGLPIVRKTVTLIGSNATIQRSSVAKFRILEVAGSAGNPASLTIQGITVSGGQTSGLLGNAARGGCLLATFTGMTPTSSTLTLDHSAVVNCRAVSGGGIYAGSLATLMASSSSVKHNTAVVGGGITLATGAAGTIGQSFVNDNAATLGSGGGLRNFGRVALTSDTVAGNFARVTGGGLCNDGAAFVGASFVLQNRAVAGGGIYAASSASTRIAGTRIQLNAALLRGGGLDNNGRAFLENSFVLMNTAPVGGGIWEGPTGTIAVVNSLIVGNTVFNCQPFATVPSCVN